MHNVSAITDRNRITFEVDGIEFVTRRQDFGLLVRAVGPGIIALVDGYDDGDPDQKARADKMIEGQDVMRKVCKEAMISPRLADVTDAEADTVTWADLGDLGPSVYNHIMGKVDSSAGNMPAPSADPEG